MRLLALAAVILLALRGHAAEVTRAGSHVFHSSFWPSLHERLRHEAQAKTAQQHALSAAEKATWDAAVAAYRKDVPAGSVVTSPEIGELASSLARIGDDETRALPPMIDAILRAAAPVYKSRIWPEDDRANRFWISVHAAMLRETGTEIAADLEMTFGITWPKSLHIEITPFAAPYGAYSPAPRAGLMLSVIASREPDYQGYAGLDLLFHEPLHHFDEKLAKLVTEERSHPVLFYTAGEFTRRALLRRGVTYKPYAYTLGIHQRQPALLTAMETHWQAYLEGRATREQAIRGLTEPSFVLRSDFNLNLHQRLMGDVEAATPPDLAALSASERETWESVLGEYRTRFKGKEPVFDRDLIEIDLVLGRGEVPKQIRALLDRAAPVYRKHWWPGDDAANREWMAKAKPLLDKYGARLAAEHARVYATPWPQQARIDVASYGGRVGAFTNSSAAGPHSVIGNRHPNYADNTALEMVMHEASHQFVDDATGTIGGPIAGHSKRLGIKPPPQLWHAILFYTSGELTRRALAADGIDYQPVGYRTVFTRGMGAYVASLDKWWKPVLDGTASREEAIAKIVEESVRK